MGVTVILWQGGSGASEWSIQYSFNAHLDRPGLLNFDVKDSSVLTVLGTPQQLPPPETVTAGPITTPVKFCWCFSRGRSVMQRDNKYFLSNLWMISRDMVQAFISNLAVAKISASVINNVRGTIDI